MPIQEIKGDLFSAHPHSSLAHCVSHDLAMGAGIAVVFKRKFGRLDELRSQQVKVGGVAVIKEESRFIYYLVTKERYFHKPSYETLTSSLQSMKDHAEQNQVKLISMPLLGCGLDRLQWSSVLTILHNIFDSTPIDIKVYRLD